MSCQIVHGDCLAVLPTLEADSIDACVTDPPYHLTSIVKRFGGKNAAPAQHGTDGAFARASRGFMGQTWDGGDIAFRPETWAEVFRVLKPGAHLVAFSGTRTYHRMVCAIEDAGFEIRDQLAWVYGSGFPKSHDISKAIDKAAGAERQKIRVDASDVRNPKATGAGRDGTAGATRPWIDEAIARGYHEKDGDVPVTDAARQWQGWGTALKPAWETVCVALKPFPAGNECGIVLRHLDITEARIWLTSCANTAGSPSGSNQKELDEVFAIAQWNAENAGNTRERLSGAMGTSQFELATNIALSIVSLWKHTLADAWKHGNTFITETGSSTTIDWKTLKLCLSGITPENIILGVNPASGLSENAHPAARFFNAAVQGWSATRTLSALAAVISQEAQASQVADARPLLNPVVLARKPLAERTIAANVLAHGTGAINVDACRIDAAGDPQLAAKYASIQNAGARANNVYGADARDRAGSAPHDGGRWPANLCHDGSPEVLAEFAKYGESKSGNGKPLFAKGIGGKGKVFGGSERSGAIVNTFADSGTAARFFYSAKADAGDRLSSKHPTVKPVDLMRWLVRMVTPPGGRVLDPFAGSGTTGMACLAEGFRAVLVEQSAEYVEDIKRRIAHVRGDDTPLFHQEQRGMFA